MQTDISNQQSVYPGNTATPRATSALADAFRASANVLLQTKQKSKNTRFDLSPFRLCAIHAIELYLNAYLLAKGYQPETIRGMQHNVSERATVAADKGLVLRRKTMLHLNSIVKHREYLVSRYETDNRHSLSQLNRLMATLDEIAAKVAKHL